MKFRGTFFTLLIIVSSIIFESKSQHSQKTLIWDFGGIVFYPDKFGVGRDVGLKYFLIYMIMEMKSPNIQSDLFKFLDTVMLDDKRFGPVGTDDGVTLPTIMRHWQAGTILGPDIIKITHEHIKKMNNLGYFSSRYEKELFERIVGAMFNPNILAKNVYPVPEGVNLLKKCAAAKNSDGTKKIRNIGCSNWDELSYKIVKDKYPEVFNLFDDIIVSGEIKKVKPDKEFYQHVINKFQLDPKTAYLIDDQQVNARGARKCNINTLVLTGWNFKRLETELKFCGIL